MGAVLGAPLRRKRKGLLLLWFGVMAFSPLPVAKRLASIRFIIANRPRWVEAVIGHRSNKPAIRGSHSTVATIGRRVLSRRH